MKYSDVFSLALDTMTLILQRRLGRDPVVQTLNSVIYPDNTK